MSENTTLLIDSSYLCYQSKFALGQLRTDTTGTGIIFGFLRQVLQLSQKFETNHLLFCWDSLKSLRRREFPEYKHKRREAKAEMSEAEKADWADAYRQFDLLREYVLPAIGYHNNILFTGYESDDIIAKLCTMLLGDNIIISADEDLFQCLYNSRFYNPGKRMMMTERSLMEEKGITPSMWGRVKQIAGCSTDNVPGVPGVGEVKAIQYLKGQMKKESKAFQSIQSHQEVIKRNESLVVLPYRNTPTPVVVKNNLTIEGITDICMEYEFESMLTEERMEEWRKVFNWEFERDVKQKIRNRRGYGQK